MEKKYTSTITMLIFLIMTRKMRQRPWKEIEIIELYAGADYSAPLELNLFSIKSWLRYAYQLYDINRCQNLVIFVLETSNKLLPVEESKSHLSRLQVFVVCLILTFPTNRCPPNWVYSQMVNLKISSLSSCLLTRNSLSFIDLVTYRFKNHT